MNFLFYFKSFADINLAVLYYFSFFIQNRLMVLYDKEYEVVFSYFSPFPKKKVYTVIRNFANFFSIILGYLLYLYNFSCNLLNSSSTYSQKYYISFEETSINSQKSVVILRVLFFLICRRILNHKVCIVDNASCYSCSIYKYTYSYGFFYTKIFLISEISMKFVEICLYKCFWNWQYMNRETYIHFTS